MKEIYMNIGMYQGRDYSKYEVSNLGNIRNAKTKRVLKPIKSTTNSGYTHYRVNLSDINNKQNKEIIARLVITTFKDNPDNKPCVNHRDEDPSNNNLNNLEWCTYSENINYGSRNERMADKKSIPVYCITNNTVYKSSAEAARQLNLDQGTINRCCRGTRKTVHGYRFKYFNDKGGC